MKLNKMDHVSAGLIVAFDADTGEVVHIREKIIETVDGKPACKVSISPEECEQVRCTAAQRRPGCRVDAVIAPPDTENHDHNGSKRYHVDPISRKLWIEIVPDEGLHLSSHQH